MTSANPHLPTEQAIAHPPRDAVNIGYQVIDRAVNITNQVVLGALTALQGLLKPVFPETVLNKALISVFLSLSSRSKIAFDNLEENLLQNIFVDDDDISPQPLNNQLRNLEKTRQENAALEFILLQHQQINGALREERRVALNEANLVSRSQDLQTLASTIENFKIFQKEMLQQRVKFCESINSYLSQNTGSEISTISEFDNAGLPYDHFAYSSLFNGQY